MKKRNLTVCIVTAALILAVLIGACMIQDTAWKMYLHHIDTRHFFDACARHNNFVGIEIEKVLELTTKNDYYIVFDEKTEYLGYSYDQWAARYPEIALNGTSRAALYCIPVENSRSREETFLKGFLVDSQGLVSDGPVDVPFAP